MKLDIDWAKVDSKVGDGYSALEDIQTMLQEYHVQLEKALEGQMETPKPKPEPIMHPDTLEALKGSIRKWERLALGAGENRGTEDCPLCQMFHGKDCVGCPVRERTGEMGGLGSPIECAGLHPSREMAQQEVDFLKSLLLKPKTCDCDDRKMLEKCDFIWWSEKLKEWRKKRGIGGLSLSSDACSLCPCCNLPLPEGGEK